MFVLLPTELKERIPRPDIPAANALLIAVNVVVFLLGGFCCVGRGCGAWSILLYGFSHFSVWHLSANMLVLWVFGNPINRRLGNGYYLLSYLGATIAVGAAAKAFRGAGAGSSGAIFAVMIVALMLMPAARLSIFYLALFPFTVLVGLLSKPDHWLKWIIRWGSFRLRCYWCLLLVPLEQLWELFWSGWNWSNLAHLLGMLCGLAIVLMLPERITMPSRVGQLNSR